MTVQLNKQNELVITIPTHAERPSSTGKMNVIASSSGFQTTTVTINGKPVKVSVNALVPLTK
jgi:hypothetical protein